MRMKQRVLTGIVGALLLLAVFMTFDTIFFNIAVLAAYFIALYEIYSAFKEQNAKALFLLLGIIGAYFVLLPYVPQVNNRLVIAFCVNAEVVITNVIQQRIITFGPQRAGTIQSQSLSHRSRIGSGRPGDRNATRFFCPQQVMLQQLGIL